ncbi:MAG: rod shape-determining protein RodA [Fluviicola sp.]|jgi:rod shape determining protein RodA|nr:rod shape-determining protein RodA [Fluviicola sp.]
MRQGEKLTSHLDWPLLITYFLFLIMGMATVYSTALDPDHPNLFDYSQKYGKQVVWLGISLFLGLLVFLIDSTIYRKFAVPIYISTLVLLVVVLFMPPINGARAWLQIGGFGIQPAEFAKTGTALLLARYISSLNIKQQNLNSVLVANAIMIVPMILILLQPDAGTFVVFTSFLFVMYREGLTYDPLVLKLVNTIPGVKFKQTWVGTHFIPIMFAIVFLCIVTLLLSNNTITFSFLPGLIIPGFFGVILSLIVFCLIAFLFLRFISTKRERRRITTVIIIAFVLSASIASSVNYLFQGLRKHQKDRIELFLGLREDPNGEDYNRNRAMAAVGSGGLAGKGYTNASVATIESNHVPESETDFIFCPFAEEWGFIGTFILIGMYMFMFLRIIMIAERQRSRFNRVYAYSVVMILFYHLAVNIGMNIGFAPVIGIPLPFFSYGGSSMMSFSMLMFILLKLDSQRSHVLQ